jgi:hypothetical protein
MFANLSPNYSIIPIIFVRSVLTILLQAAIISLSLFDLYSSTAERGRGERKRQNERKRRHEETQRTRANQRQRYTRRHTQKQRIKPETPRDQRSGLCCHDLPEAYVPPVFSFALLNTTRGSGCAVAECATQLHNRDQSSSANSAFGTVLQPAISILELSHVVQPLELVKAASTISVLWQENLPQFGHLQNPTPSTQESRDTTFSYSCSLLAPYE